MFLKLETEEMYSFVIYTKSQLAGFLTISYGHNYIIRFILMLLTSVNTTFWCVTFQ